MLRVAIWLLLLLKGTVAVVVALDGKDVFESYLCVGLLLLLTFIDNHWVSGSVVIAAGDNSFFLELRRERILISLFIDQDIACCFLLARWHSMHFVQLIVAPHHLLHAFFDIHANGLQRALLRPTIEARGVIRFCINQVSVFGSLHLPYRRLAVEIHLLGDRR